MRELDFSKYLVDTLNDIKFSWRQNAIILGATSGSGGGIGGPVGGIIGQLGQTYVAGDTDELRTLSSGSATSLLWNLNRIRYWETNQISTLAPSPTFTGQIWVDGSSGSAFKMRNESDTAWITLTGTGGSTPLDANAPLDVAASASVGTSGSASHGDHAHRGVSSFNVAGYPYAYDHIELIAGAGATITQSSGSVTIANSSSGSSVALGAAPVSVTSPNDISSGSHSHQALWSSKTGSASTLLGTNASGQIEVEDVILDNVYGLKYSNSGWLGSVGWGLTGNRTIVLPDLTGTVALGAGTLTNSTTSSVTVAEHTHTITNSSIPGAAASIVSTDSSGSMTLQGFKSVTTVSSRFGLLPSVFLGLPELRGIWMMSSVNESGDVLDLSGQGRTFTNTGTTPRAIYNNCVPYCDFNGSSQYLTRADEGGTSITGGLTLGGWFWFDAVAAGAERDLIFKFTSAGAATGSYALFKSTNNTRVNFLVVNGSTNTYATAEPTGDANLSVSTGQWYFIVARYNPSTSVAARVFPSAWVTNTTSIPASINDSTVALTVGAFSSGGNYLDGRAGPVFLCATALPDLMLNDLFEITRTSFGV